MSRDSGGEDFVVRRFEPSDADAVYRLHRQALRAEGTDPDDVPGADDLRDVKSAYLDAGGEFLVAERRRNTDGEPETDDEREIVAVGGLTVDGTEGELLRIAVHPDHQREGYGSAIVDGLENAARERCLERIVLTTARRQQAATEFYPARDYEEVGREQEGEYRLLHYEKSLGD